MVGEMQELRRPIRVVVADDHAGVRDVLADDLALAGFTVCALAADRPTAVDAAVREQPDICLLDVNMPGGGIAAAWEITERLPETKVVMLTTSRDEAVMVAALRAGASGYLLKDIPAERLPDALGAVLEGEATFPRTALARLLDESTRRRSWWARSNDPRLGDEQKRVLELAGDGRRTCDIASELGIGPDAVRRDVESALRAFRAASADEALAAASGR